MSDYSFISNAHPSFIEEMFLRFTADPMSVEEGWRTFFSGFEYAKGSDVVSESGSANIKEINVFALIEGYRNRGHLLSNTNPVRDRMDYGARLSLADFGLNNDDLNTSFAVGKEIGLPNAKLKDIVARLQELYCGAIGFEYMYIADNTKREWLRQRIEQQQVKNGYGISLEKKKRVLDKLNQAVTFEEFLGKKFVGQKRFSIEGGESVIAGLDGIVNIAAENDMAEVIVGMAHRGRLNILTNVLQKDCKHIFREFKETAIPGDLEYNAGDVKYHLGHSIDATSISGKKIGLSLAPNPSHLETVGAVIEGMSRAKADKLYGEKYDKVLPIIIHGDAAAVGQGIVYETVQMSRLDGYTTGGTLHYVINNQVGFTTDFMESRSTTYCTAAANMIEAPAFHVNGDDPEAVLFASELAFEYRQQFGEDVFIDVLCYRKHGHNEGDDPKFTQPVLYDIIKKHPTPKDVYAKVMESRGEITAAEVKEMETNFKNHLQAKFEESEQDDPDYSFQPPLEEWKDMLKANTYKFFEKSPETGIDLAMIDKILNHLDGAPEGLEVLRKMGRLFKTAKGHMDNNQLDWALAELLAYCSILLEGKDVRITGQDVERGTFGHRHAVIRNVNTAEKTNRLEGLSDDQGKFRIFNSLLSEFAVLGYEYGYAWADPNALVIWEAQFGDFYNGAQTMVDQYIFSAESKWNRMNGLVMFLPHGLAGQGPEHSSARVERFLQNCAEYNVTVANVTTPANLFHILRRQLARPFRKPLILMTPKSLLRHQEVISSKDDFVTGTSFTEMYDDPTVGPRSNKSVERVLCCTGKIYYDLAKYKRENKLKNVAIVRLEQMYPFPTTQMDAIKKRYANAEFLWVQEEPANMGAWQYVFTTQSENYPMKLVARRASASPASGYKKVHVIEQAELIEKAFAGLK